MVKCWWKDAAEVVPQYSVETSRGLYRMDVAIPKAKIGLEFDGAAKLGADESSWHQRSRKFLDRQAALVAAGWKIRRYTIGDVSAPSRMLAEMKSALEGEPGRRDRPGGPLWQPLTDAGRHS